MITQSSLGKGGGRVHEKCSFFSDGWHTEVLWHLRILASSATHVSVLCTSTMKTNSSSLVLLFIPIRTVALWHSPVHNELWTPICLILFMLCYMKHWFIVWRGNEGQTENHGRLQWWKQRFVGGGTVFVTSWLFWKGLQRLKLGFIELQSVAACCPDLL